jgi:hypothetical protein
VRASETLNTRDHTRRGRQNRNGERALEIVSGMTTRSELERGGAEKIRQGNRAGTMLELHTAARETSTRHPNRCSPSSGASKGRASKSSPYSEGGKGGTMPESEMG